MSAPQGPSSSDPYAQGSGQPQGGYGQPQGSQPAGYPPSGFQGAGYPQGSGGYGGAPYPGGTTVQGGGGSGMAVTALVFGIIALVFCWTAVGGILFGLVAVVLGIVAVRKVNAGRAGGKGMAIGGIVTGAIGLVIGGLFVAAVVALFNNSSFSSYTDCLDKATTQQERQDCAQQFSDSVNS